MQNTGNVLHRLFVLVAGLGLASAAAVAAPPEPFFVDLTGVVNTLSEDDGIANNGKGGWTDEGVNDMFIYPPIGAGRVTRNGYQFQLPEATANAGHSVVMLQGSSRAKDKPATVKVALPNVKGRYLYVLQNSAAEVIGQPKEYRVATYTVTYADGTTQEIPVRDGVEIRPWWSGQWWDNSGRASWPIFMGVNLYSLKWNKYIGVWAMQWENPTPDKPIAALSFHSEGKAVPVIWAVTLADEDFYEPEARRKTDFVRPPGPPSDYFRGKQAIEQRAIMEAATQEKRLQGIVRAEMIRNDLVAVTMDDALDGLGAGSGAGVVETNQVPDCFTVTDVSTSGAAGVHPARVGRQTSECWRGDIGTFPENTLYLHVFYLQMPAPLQSGHTYRIAAAGIDARFRAAIELAYDEKKSATPVIKINQGAYARVTATNRYAYLGWWAGDLGKVDFSACKTYEVVEESSGKTVLTGAITPRATDDVRSGEDIFEMSLGGLTQAGRYHIRIPGLACSDTFAVGGDAVRQLYMNTSRAFFHQRCGQELKQPWTPFQRPACHVSVYAGGRLVGSPGYIPAANEAIHTFHGGYHDAGDDDVFTYHLRATAQLLDAVEQYPGTFKDGDLNIPESGNGIPDVLDEAAWALSVYHDNQQADGGIPLGRGNEQDSQRDWERTHAGAEPPFGLFPPTEMSCTEYAAVAAHFARLIRPYDAARATAYAESAKRAYAWACTHVDNSPKKKDEGQRLFRAWAAAEIFTTTGDAAIQAELKELITAGAFKQVPWQLSGLTPLCIWSVASGQQPGSDPAQRDALRKKIIESADSAARHTFENPYRMGHDGKAAMGWGNGNGGGYYGDVLLRAWWLTRQQKYLDAASLNADFQLGANPLSKTFITGIGVRHPVQPEINESLYTQPRRTGDTVAGITVYGLANGQPPGYPASVPLYRHWRDIGQSAEVSSEFTITETIGNSAMLYAALFAEDQKAHQ